MIKQEDIFEQQSEQLRFQKQNRFCLPDEQRNNINKRLPRGFCLVRCSELPRQETFSGQIQYVPMKREIRVASQQLARQFVVQTQLPSENKREGRGEEKTLRCGTLPEGRSKQGEKIKGIIQRFRKHLRYVAFNQHLSRLGFASAMLEIEAENRKNIHTIESFKDRSLYLFQQALNVTYQPDKIALINQMIDELQFLVENAQKAEFAGSLVLVQKSIDKVTREISEIRETGSYYYRKRRRNQKNYDEKELLYIAELLKQLPAWEMVGIAEIIEDRPFSEISPSRIQFDLHMLKNKKLREIELYVKKKLCNYYKSRERKLAKIKAKRKANQPSEPEAIHPEVQKGQNDLHMDPNEDKGQFFGLSHQVKKQGIEYIFELEDIEDQRNPGDRDRSNSNIQRISSHNDYDDDFIQDRHDDLFFPASQQSARNPSLSDRSEGIPELLGEPLPDNQEDNVEFEQPNFLKHNYREPGEDYDSSDSSYITDEEDSDY